jgi:protein O-mannosyl-transferase
MKGRFILKSIFTKPLSIFLITCLGIIVYSNTLHCSFEFDDFVYIINNFNIRNLHNFLNIWEFYPCRFVTFLSFAFNYHFNGLNVFGYHLFNLSVHLISAILVWWFTLLTLSTPAMKEQKIAHHADSIALFIGLIFVSHPIQIEAVTYISQRTASLATLFYIASLCFYVKSRLPEPTKPIAGLNKFYYFCSLLTAIVAMFTKEITVTLPLIILLYEFSFLKVKKSLNWKYLPPFLITLFIIPLTILFTKSKSFQEIQVIAGGPTGISPIHYFLTQFRVIVTYIRLVFLPLNQNLDYDYPIFKSIFEWPVLISGLFLITILFGAKHLFSKYRLVSFSIFWFFLTLLPESSFLPAKDIIFEHRLYLPLVGYSMFLVSGIYYFFEKDNIKTIVKILAVVVIFYSFLTYQRNKVWENGFTLWDDAVQKSPHKARPYNGRGLAYYDQGKFTQAISDFDKEIALDPNFAEAYGNRGDVYSDQGEYTQAISDFTKAIEINPQFAGVYNNRAGIYLKQNNINQAISDINKAIELYPKFAVAYNNLGNIHSTQGHFSQAISDFNKAIEIDPNYIEAYNNRERVYYLQNNFAKTSFRFKNTIKINHNNANFYNERGLSFAKQGMFTQALSDYNKAIESNSNFAEAYNNRGNAYNQQGDFSKAILDFNRVIEISPQLKGGALLGRGVAYAQQGNFTQAIADCSKAIEINPKFIEAYNNRGLIYYNHGDYIQALLDYNKVIEMNPNIAEAYNNRGNVYNSQSNLNQAILDFNKAIEINPNYADAYYNRERNYYLLKEYDKAWADVHTAEGLGISVDTEFVNELKKASGKDE